eukprot:EC687039.1.p4 GENE.EC687039.1~~EC687039.1.p4  ORF type:complete len:111 (-),score=36.97 EC687039.1:18-350(-)
MTTRRTGGTRTPTSADAHRPQLPCARRAMDHRRRRRRRRHRRGSGTRTTEVLRRRTVTSEKMVDSLPCLRGHRHRSESVVETTRGRHEKRRGTRHPKRTYEWSKQLGQSL